LARDYITDIEVIRSRDHIYRTEWSPKRGETFWEKLLDFGPFKTHLFPNLQSASFKLEVRDCANVPGLILQRAPALQHISLEGGDPRWPGHEDGGDDDECACDMWSQYEDVMPDYENLRSLHVACKGCHDNGVPPYLVRHLLDNVAIPSLKIRVEDARIDEDNGMEWLYDIIESRSLTYLEYDVPGIPFSEALEERDVEHSVLRSLVIPVPEMEPMHERLQVSLSPSTSWMTARQL
jgi:hypothetical protein